MIAAMLVRRLAPDRPSGKSLPIGALAVLAFSLSISAHPIQEEPHGHEDRQRERYLHSDLRAGIRDHAQDPARLPGRARRLQARGEIAHRARAGLELLARDEDW